MFTIPQGTPENDEARAPARVQEFMIALRTGLVPSSIANVPVDADLAFCFWEGEGSLTDLIKKLVPRQVDSGTSRCSRIDGRTWHVEHKYNQGTDKSRTLVSTVRLNGSNTAIEHVLVEGYGH